MWQMERIEFIKDVAAKEAEAAERLAAYAFALHAAGHDHLAHLFRTEATHCRHLCILFKGSPHPAKGATSLQSVRRCFEEMLALMQLEIVPLLNRALNSSTAEDRPNLEAALADNERQLDWMEAALHSIQELGEAHYLSQLKT